MKLPPYGKSIDTSKDLVWIWAGHNKHVHKTVKAWGKNTCAFFTYLDPREFEWPVKGRNVLIVHFLQPQDIWIQQLAFNLLLSDANEVAELMWRPHGEVIGEKNITLNHYKRN